MVIQGEPLARPLTFSGAPAILSLMNDTPDYPNPWHPDDEAKWSPVTHTWVFTKKYPNPPELEKYLYAGQLNQLCNYCGHIEPAGAFCHECGRQVDPSVTWFKPQALDADGKPRRGRPKKEDILRMVGNANA